MSVDNAIHKYIFFFPLKKISNLMTDFHFLRSKRGFLPFYKIYVYVILALFLNGLTDQSMVGNIC